MGIPDIDRYRASKRDRNMQGMFAGGGFPGNQLTNSGQRAMGKPRVANTGWDKNLN